MATKKKKTAKKKPAKKTAKKKAAKRKPAKKAAKKAKPAKKAKAKKKAAPKKAAKKAAPRKAPAVKIAPPPAVKSQPMARESVSPATSFMSGLAAGAGAASAYSSFGDESRHDDGEE